MVDRPTRHRSRHSRLAGVGLVLLIASCLPLAFGGPAGSAAQDPSASLRLLQQTPVLQLEDSFFVDVEVGVPPDFDDELEVVATVHQRVKNRAAFASTNLSSDLGSVIGVSQNIDVAAVAGPTRDANVPIRVTLPIGQTSVTCLACINIRNDGVYPVLVELRSRNNESVVDSFTTYLVRAVAPRVDPLRVAVIVPLRTAPARDSRGEEQNPSTRNLIGFIEALISRPSTPVTLAPTPETLETLKRQTGENLNSSPLLDQIRQILPGREVLSLPYRPLGVTIANDLRFGRLLEGNKSLGGSTIGELLDAPKTTDVGIYTDLMVSSKALSALGQSRVVVQESALAPTGDNAPVAARPVLIDAAAIDGSDGVPVPALVLDRQLEDHFVRKLSSRVPGADDVLRGQHLIADLALIQAAQRPGAHGVAVLVPESTSQATLSEVLAGMEAGTIIEPVSVSALFELPLASSAGSALVRTPILEDAIVPPGVVGQVNRIVERLDGYRSAFQNPVTDADDLEKRLIVALSSVPRAQTAAPTQAFRSALNRIEDETNARIGTIRLSQNDVVTLTGREQEVPIPIINDSGRPATVVLEVSSDNVSLEGSVADPDRPGQLIIRRTISIESRIHEERVLVTTRGPGSFSMLLRLTTPTGLPLTNVRTTLRSTAVGGLGKILTIGALLVLGVWWIRSTLRTRRNGSRLRHPSSAAPSIPPEEPAVADTKQPAVADTKQPAVADTKVVSSPPAERLQHEPTN